MGLRDRLKGVLKKARDAARPGPIVGQPPRSQPPPPAPPAPAPAPPAPPVEAAAEPVVDEKVARHFEKARMAVLRFVEGEGGEATLHSMHAYSERRYFIAHKRFSELMETLVDAGLVVYDVGEGVATLTEEGRRLLAETPTTGPSPR